MPISPIVFMTWIVAILAFGPGFLVVAAVSWIGSAFAGAYLASQIQRLDRALSINVAKATGKKAEPKANDLARMSANAAKWGVVCPPLPLILLAAGIYFGSIASKEERRGTVALRKRVIDCTTITETGLPQGFTAPGRLVIR